MASDQKKKALEALERRFDFQKAMATQKEEVNLKKRKRNPSEARDFNVARERREANQVSSPSPSTKKGHTPKREASRASGEDEHPAYHEIPQFVDENLVGTSTMASSKEDVVKNVVLDILQHGDKGRKKNKGSLEKIFNDHNILLDNFVARDNSLTDARVKALQSHSKRSKKHMTMRQHRKCGSLTFPKEFHNFNLFKPMHEMWKEYIIKILSENREKQLPQTLLMADLHGAFLQVVDCKSITFKGISGIMIRETAETFGLITEDNKFRVVPKHGSVFIFQAGCWKITLRGDKLSLRNSTT